MKEYPCHPPDYFLDVYEEAWERAFGAGNKVWAHERTGGGTFNVRRKLFKEIAKDLRGLDDIAVMDRLFRAVAAAVRYEARREQDVAEWHLEVDEFMARLREIRG